MEYPRFVFKKLLGNEASMLAVNDAAEQKSAVAAGWSLTVEDALNPQEEKKKKVKADGVE